MSAALLPWTNGPWLAFDLETTGVDVTADRIVTATLLHIEGSHIDAHNWLVNPGIDIPEGRRARRRPARVQDRAEVPGARRHRMARQERSMTGRLPEPRHGIAGPATAWSVVAITAAYLAAQIIRSIT